MKKPVLIIISLIMIALVLSVVRIYISNQDATSGVVLGQIQEQISNYQTENTLLAEKLYTASSLTNINSKAETLGFTEQKTDFVLNGQVPVAFKQ